MSGLHWIRWPLLAIAVPYGLVVRARAALYERGWLPRRQLPCRVVSVGNLTVGGTGKTPVVIALVEWLVAHGQRVGVLSRGYSRRTRTPMVLVSDGRTILVGPAEGGDEPHLIAQRCPTAVVAVGPDRFRLGRWVLERFPIDCFILDDGFQHLALKRDVNLLLVDITDPKGLKGLFPFGRLREPLSAASRATTVLLTRLATRHDSAEAVAEIVKTIAGNNKPIPVKFRPDSLVDVQTGTTEDVGRVAGRTAVAFSGIGNPASFRMLLDQIGLRVLDEVVFSDHHTYTSADLATIRARAGKQGVDLLITTEKDAVKVAGLMGTERPEIPVLALRLGTEILEGREELEALVLGKDEKG